MSKYFFDSSAIVEIINNQTIQEKFNNEKITTNYLNLSEVYYYSLKNHNKQTADYWIKSLVFQIIELNLSLSAKGALFRFEHKNRKFSYADSIGYVTALQNNLIFLTCDKDFIGFNNVEFVK